MQKVYIRRLCGNEQFEMRFKYVNKELKVVREFNFKNDLSEKVDAFLNTVACDVRRYLIKEKKKRGIRTGVRDEPSGFMISLRMSNMDLPKETVCERIFSYDQDEMVLKIHNTEYKLIVHRAKVDVITLPVSILATCPVYAIKLWSVFTNEDRLVFTWLKSQDQKKWTVVGNDYIFTPSIEEVGHYLKLICTQQYRGSWTTEVVSTSRVDSISELCPFELRHFHTNGKAQGKQFRVVSYNILAEQYCSSVLYNYCPAYAIKTDYRKQLLLKEIIGFNGDIICLQEVEKDVFECDFHPVLSHLGYGSDFVRKGRNSEGLAFFFNKKRFRKLHSEFLVFSKRISVDPLFADIWEKIAKNSKLAQKMLYKQTTVQVNVVESLENEEIVVVGNTHLLASRNIGHIRLLHGGLAIRYLENVVDKLKKQFTGKRISLIFCGDFNSNPNCGIYRLYTTGGIPKDYYEYSMITTESIEDLELTHGFQLGSACGTPKYTNFAAGFLDCLDYIFYEKSNLAVSQVVPLPSHEEVIRHTALPSIVSPSDHLSLVADLKWL